MDLEQSSSTANFQSLSSHQIKANSSAPKKVQIENTQFILYTAGRII